MKMWSSPILFQINHYRPNGIASVNSRVYVSIRKNDIILLRSAFGSHDLYQWIRSIFERLSTEQREGDLMFYSPGKNIISISWNVQSNYIGSQFLPSLRRGIEMANRMKALQALVDFRLRLFLDVVQSMNWPITIAAEPVHNERFKEKPLNTLNRRAP